MSKIEKNGLVFFLQNAFVYLPAADIGNKYRQASIKYSVGKLFHRINVLDREITDLGVLNEGKGLFSKFILSQEAEGGLSRIWH